MAGVLLIQRSFIQLQVLQKVIVGQCMHHVYKMFLSMCHKLFSINTASVPPGIAVCKQ